MRRARPGCAQRSLFGGRHRGIGAVDAGHQRELTLGVFGDVSLFVELGRAPPWLAHEVDREVRDDAVQPREERRAAFERVEPR